MYVILEDESEVQGATKWRRHDLDGTSTDTETSEFFCKDMKEAGDACGESNGNQPLRSSRISKNDWSEVNNHVKSILLDVEVLEKYTEHAS